MSRPLLEHRYFDRMASSLGDKLQILALLMPGDVADIGAGGGELATAIAELDYTRTVYAIDDAVDSIQRLHVRSNIETMHGSFERLRDIPEPLDNIVLCSVMHEVWSYGGLTDAARWNSWHAAMDAVVEAMAVGGRLIIRDGVRPTQHEANERCTLVAPDEAGDLIMERYATMTPFPEAVPVRTGFRTWAGTAATLAEALLTVNWGKTSLHRESQERYMLLDLDGYADAVTDMRPLSLVSRHAYTQPGYQHHLSEWLLLDSHGLQWFPETNALWVFEKTAA